ncbi:MAG: hypothetical protein OHK0029_20420 [Armatimonadaceae bacterium]
MPNINLIAARRAEKKRLEQLTRQLFFGLSASVALFVGIVMYIGYQQVTMQGQLREAEEAMRRLQPKLDRIAEIETSIQDVAPRVDTLQKAKMDTLRWRALLQVVSQSIPNETYLTAITASGGEGATALRLSGYSTNQSLVGETILRLQTHPLFEKVDLDFTNTTPTNSGRAPLVNFGISTTLRNATTGPEQKKDPSRSINADKREAAVNKLSAIRGGGQIYA